MSDELSLTVNKVLETGISRAQLSRELGLGSGTIINKWGTIKRAHTKKQFDAIKQMRGMLQIEGREKIEEVNVDPGMDLMGIDYTIRESTSSVGSDPLKLTAKINGVEKTQTVSSWEQELGISGVTIRKRKRAGMSDEEALGLRSQKVQSVNAQRNVLKLRARVNGVIMTKTIREWGEFLDVNPSLIRSRKARNLSDSKALGLA